MKLFALALLLSAACIGSGETANVTYTRAFPGSDPPFFRVAVNKEGGLEYSEAPDSSQTLHAQLGSAAVASIFAMAHELNDFKTPLESGLKVANTGKKTFRFQSADGQSSQATFNYSTIPVAAQLLEKFEQIASSERAYLDLDRTVHFDKLGVNDSLATIESLWLRKQLAAAGQFVPLLNRVATHESFMHLARDRAARLKDEFEKQSQSDVPGGDSKSK